MRVAWLLILPPLLPLAVACAPAGCDDLRDPGVSAPIDEQQDYVERLSACMAADDGE